MEPVSLTQNPVILIVSCSFIQYLVPVSGNEILRMYSTEVQLCILVRQILAPLIRDGKNALVRETSKSQHP